MRPASVLLSAALLNLPAGAVAQPRPPQDAGTVTVFGQRLQDYRDRLTACLARRCPPNEDIDASLALAEALLVGGEYRDARRTLTHSISRNRRHARAFPEPVSDLNRANARVARHLGLDRDAEYSTWEILRALRAGLPQEDHRHFTARLEIAESMAMYGYRYDYAQRELQALIQRARAAGRDDVVAMAELRILWLDYLQGPFRGMPSGALTAMAASPDPRRSIGARMMMIRIYNRRGDRARADALMAELARGAGGRRRQLLFNPPYQLAAQASGAPQGAITRAETPPQPPPGEVARGASLTSNLAGLMIENFEDKWIDVGFWVRPDGRVEGLEVLRSRHSTVWARPLLQSIRERRYSTADDSNYRLERYTYTSAYREVGSTRIARRSPQARVVYFDLTEGAAPTPQPAPANPGTTNPGQ